MKLIAQLIILTILLAACTTPPADIAATQTVTPSATASPALGLTPDSAASPQGGTPTPDTPTITPLPTIPTFTPTFDVRTIVTATPAPRAECPKEQTNNAIVNPLPEQGKPYRKDYIEKIIQFLNAGGRISDLHTELSKPNEWGISYGELKLEDITNDNAPELFIKIAESNFVLKCDQQTYKVI